MSSLIGLGGWAFGGKDTVADRLETEYGWVKTYMSKPLETALLRMTPWTDVRESNWETRKPEILGSVEWMRYQELHGLLGYDESKKNLDVRNYLQLLGTEIGRNMFGENVWVDFAFGEVDRLLSDGLDVAITGIRFPNELDAIRQRDGWAVWIERPGYGPVNSHTSDNTLSAEDFDVVVRNEGSLDDLYLAVEALVEVVEAS